MSKQTINIGSTPNKGDGDPLRIAFAKVNENFQELYDQIGPTADLQGVDIRGDDSVTLIDSAASKINLDGTIDGDIIPKQDGINDIGSTSAGFKNIYGSIVTSSGNKLVDVDTGKLQLDGTVKGNIIPDTDIAYDIGSPTNRFKDLWLSGNTLYLGNNTISVNTLTNEFEFSAPVTNVVLTQRDIVGNVYSQDSVLIIDGVTGEVKNLGGELPSYYLDYNNSTNKPGLDDILTNGATTTSQISVGAIVTNGEILGNGIDGISNIGTVTGSGTGNIFGFTDVEGTGLGTISNFQEIQGTGGGTISGFSSVRATDSLVVQGISFNGTNVDNWKVAYTWGDHNTKGYATVTYVDNSVANVLSSTGFNTFWDNRFAAKSTDFLAEGVNNKYFTTTRVTDILNNVLDPYAKVSYITQQVVGLAPTNLNTLAKIAASIGNNPAYSTSVTSQLATKLNISDFSSNWDSKLATANTGGLSEGSNLYYTDNRVQTYLTNNNYITQSVLDLRIANIIDAAPSALDTLNELAAALGDDPNFATTVTNSIAGKLNSADFNGLWDLRYAGKNTTNLPEGTNLYYTDTRARTALSVLDTGGDGSLTYNIAQGQFTYTGPSAAEARAHFTGSDEITFDANTGVISLTKDILTSADVWQDNDTSLMTAAAIGDLITEMVTLTAEADTLTSVTQRGSATPETISVGGIVTPSITTNASEITFNNKVVTDIVIDFGSYSG